MNLDLAKFAELAWLQLWQVSLVALGVGLIVQLGCRRRPHLAYGLWLVVVLKCLLPPVWSSPTGLFSWMNFELAGRRAWVSEGQKTAGGAWTNPVSFLSGSRAGIEESVTSSAPSLPTRETERSRSANQETGAETLARSWASQRPGVAIVAGIWIFGVMAFAGVLFWKRIRCSAMIRRSTVPPSGAIASLAGDLARRLGVRASVRLVIISEPFGPGAYGVLRPKLIVPQLLVANKSTAELEPVLAHELIHIRRGDAAVAWLQLWAQGLWWFHPLIWWVNRETCREREKCCDEEVVASLECPPAKYAQSLLDVLKLKRQLRPIYSLLRVRPAEVTSTRLENIMKYSGKVSPRARRWCWAAMIMAGALTLPGRGWVAGSRQLETKDPPARTQDQDAPNRETAGSSDKRDRPGVPRDAIFIDTVRRGTMLREVRGAGTLVPEQSLIIYAATEGRVERILVLPGAAVKADTVLIKLSNPELEQSLRDVEWQLQAAETELVRLHSQSQGEQLQQEAALAKLKSELMAAQAEAERVGKLSDGKAASTAVAENSLAKAEELTRRFQLEERLLKVKVTSAQAGREQQEIELRRLRSLLELKQRQIRGLQVRAGMDGVVQQIGGTERLQEGQAVTSSSILAKIVQPGRLRAELAIPDAQAREIEVGQPALIDTRAAMVPGRVVAVDPVVSVATGAVTVYVSMEGELPKGIRPGSRVEGTIEIEKMPNVLYVGRQVGGQANSQVSLFKITEAGKAAVRVRVKLGRSTTDKIEVLEGLQAGDQVILSDMSSFKGSERVNLK